ncbi:hypothetical protein T492DRAFT_322701 [Pavlovales sp. CCMP2436]|nr:hypothetical protein T492DRAFT_322701 [Pavlovales sp. CCMP2436]
MRAHVQEGVPSYYERDLRELEHAALRDGAGRLVHDVMEDGHCLGHGATEGGGRDVDHASKFSAPVAAGKCEAGSGKLVVVERDSQCVCRLRVDDRVEACARVARLVRVAVAGKVLKFACGGEEREQITRFLPADGILKSNGLRQAALCVCHVAGRVRASRPAGLKRRASGRRGSEAGRNTRLLDPAEREVRVRPTAPASGPAPTLELGPRASPVKEHGGLCLCRRRETYRAGRRDACTRSAPGGHTWPSPALSSVL